MISIDKTRKQELIMQARFNNMRDMLTIAEKLRFYGYDVSLIKYEHTNNKDMEDLRNDSRLDS